jgi:hypothetical protein
MNGSRKKALVVFAIVVLIMIALGGVYYGLQQVPSLQDAFAPAPDVVELTCAIGSEKKGYLDNPKVIQILEREARVRVDFVKKGTIEQVVFPDEELYQFDCLWPSNDLAMSLLEVLHDQGLPGYGPINFKAERIFQTALVPYTRNDIADSLVEAGEAYEKDRWLYFTDSAQIIQYMLDGKSFGEVGYPPADKYTFYIDTSDPRESNSGNMAWTMWYPSILTGQYPLSDEKTLAEVAPDLVDTFRRLPAMEHSTGTMFETYTSNPLKKGIFIAYEFQWVERSDAANADLIRIYMDPTVMSVHPLIILENDQDTPEIEAAKERLLEVMYTNPDLHRIALEEHGYLTANPDMRDAVENYADLAAEVGLNMSNNPMPVPKPKLAMIMTALYMDPNLITEFMSAPDSLTLEEVMEVYAEYGATGVGW